MMIGHPNQAKSCTLSLFMPTTVFDDLSNEDKLLQFFHDNFPDSIPLIGVENIVHDFFSNTPQSLISIKCSPYNVGSKSLIMGDAAHAMVPFYAQGLNCGMEDCLVLEEALEKHNMDLNEALKEYSEMRNPDAEAICDLSMYNYEEVRKYLLINLIKK